MDTLITSHRNPLVKRIRRLGQRKFRRQERAFFVEGPRGFLAAVEQSAPIEAIIIAPELLRSQLCYEAAEAAAARGVTLVQVASDVYAKLSERDNPSGVGAIVRTTETELASLPRTREAVYVVLVEPADPGNVGTIMRTVDAVGAAGLILTGQATDPTHPNAVKASMGSLFTVPYCQVEAAAEVIAWARDGGMQIVATSAHADQTYWTASFRRPLLLLLGSERHGLDAELLAAADLAVTIPMSGTVSSLNLAIAASLLLYEVHRRALAP